MKGGTEGKRGTAERRRPDDHRAPRTIKRPTHRQDPRDHTAEAADEAIAPRIFADFRARHVIARYCYFVVGGIRPISIWFLSDPVTHTVSHLNKILLRKNKKILLAHKQKKARKR